MLNTSLNSYTLNLANTLNLIKTKGKLEDRMRVVWQLRTLNRTGVLCLYSMLIGFRAAVRPIPLIWRRLVSDADRSDEADT